MAPKNPNQTGAWDYMGRDKPAGFAELQCIGSYPGVFMTHEVTPLPEGDTQGTSHLDHGTHHIKYTDPDQAWHDRAAGEIKCADGQHDCIEDALCQEFIKNEDAGLAMLVVAGAHRFLRAYPGYDKGSWNHTSRAARENGRRLKGGIWRYRALVKMGELELANKVILRIAYILQQQIRAWREDMKAGRLPYRKYGGDYNRHSVAFCGVWWWGLDEIRQLSEENSWHVLAEVKYMMKELSKLCFKWFTYDYAKEKWRLPYSIFNVGGVIVPEHLSSMGKYAWAAAMAYSPSPDEQSKYMQLAAQQPEPNYR